MAFSPFKALAFYFDSYFSGLATTLGLKGNSLPLTIVTQAPQGTPPGGVGLQIYVDPITHVVTFYIWNGSQWLTK